MDITSCSNNKAKRVSKKGEEHWQVDDRTLFCLPRNESFSACLPLIKPFVMMQPVDDAREGHDLMDAILEHRIGTLLHSQGCLFNKLTAESLNHRGTQPNSILSFRRQSIRERAASLELIRI